MDDESHDNGASEELVSREPSVGRFSVVRVADEVLVDLMAKASGITYEEAKGHIHVRELDGVQIPFANPDLLWRMKSRSRRPKDQGDLFFLRELFAAEGRQPPDE